ncbi:GNAT family N-acetyltransferase [Nocardioides sp.]|uniref:GNAT family N-acetyltransferase n=1 Tax=Nocardioides sp. TaxID=35761 RepID=UPI00286E923F|nr:GNAT family N-acetyltransferase [Nocardioides sp.]
MPDAPPALPEGLTTRPLTRADSRILFDLIAAQEREDTGEVDIEEADLVSDWAKPSYDLSASSVAVFDGDLLVAYAELMGADRADAAVLPAYRGRGIGTWLAAWLRALGRSRGASVVGQPVPEGSAGDLLLAALGYRIRWTSWILQLPEGRQIPTRDLPPGYVVREALEADLEPAHDVLEDAFLEWSERDREPYEDFAASTFGRPGFAPWNFRVAVDPAGAVVATALVFISTESPTAYVSRLAVRRDQRNRGLAQALLVDSFAAGREHGATVSELSTDSRTGALGLYEKVGMVTTGVWVNRCVDL